MSTLVAADTLMNTSVQTYACSPVHVSNEKHTSLSHSMKYCLVENGIMIANPQWLVDIGWYNPRYVDISFWIMKEFPPLFFGSPMFPQSYALFIHQHDAPVRHGPAQTWHAWPGG